MFCIFENLNFKAIFFLGALLAFSLVVGCEKSSGDVTERVIRVTGIPDENPARISERSAPLVKRLQKALGRPVEYLPVTDYAAAVQGLRSGKVDFAWLGGFTFVQAKRLAGAKAVVMREVDRRFQSIFIAYRKSHLTSLRDLKGKKFSFGSKSSTSGHLMPRHYLMSKWSIDPDQDFLGTPLFSGTHDATALAVSSGRVDAGALNVLVYNRLLQSGRLDPSTIVELGRTPPFVDYVWAARAGLDKDLQEKFARAFLDLDVTKPEDLELLSLQNAKKYTRALETDFDDIEAIALSCGLLQ